MIVKWAEETIYELNRTPFPFPPLSTPVPQYTYTYTYKLHPAHLDQSVCLSGKKKKEPRPWLRVGGFGNREGGCEKNKKKRIIYIGY